LRAAIGDRTFRHVGELTRTHPETVRRYLQGPAPGVEFLSAVCTALGISGEWLLTGRGPMRSADVAPHALRQGGAPNLPAAIANAVERLIEWVDRTEVFVQTLEVRLRGARPAGGTEAMSHDETDQPYAAAHLSDRARLLARAVAKRSCPDDRPDASARGA
jgi:hypothetical protein